MEYSSEVKIEYRSIIEYLSKSTQLLSTTGKQTHIYYNEVNNRKKVTEHVERVSKIRDVDVKQKRVEAGWVPSEWGSRAGLLSCGSGWLWCSKPGRVLRDLVPSKTFREHSISSTTPAFRQYTVDGDHRRHVSVRRSYACQRAVMSVTMATLWPAYQFSLAPWSPFEKVLITSVKVMSVWSTEQR